VAGRPRILLLTGDTASASNLLGGDPDGPDLVPASGTSAFRLLANPAVVALLLEVTRPADRESAGLLLQAGEVLDALTDGLAVVDLSLRIQWTNRSFREWCTRSPVGLNFYEALGSPNIRPADAAPPHNALVGEATTKHLVCRDNRIFELHITPQPGAPTERLIALCRDVTDDVHHLQQLDALHRAGQELAALDPAQLADMPPEERIEFLKHNIRRCTHDLLHYDIIELRMLDRKTKRLEPLLSQGMIPEASCRRLEAREEGNGVTGYVAATGKSYLCRDTRTDPRYLVGASQMRSSMTVPLILQDEIVGTLNVESPQRNAFDEQDLRFCEIFAREVAASMNTLELLTAEKRETTNLAVDTISREVALPVDDILQAGAAVLETYIGVDGQMAEKLRTILASARRIKQCIQTVGEEISPASSKATEELPPFKGLRVLVADNDERVRKLAHSILGRWGCVVETARDAKEALTLAKLSSYHAILTDIRLPGMSGYDVYRRLREAQPQACVVLMTEYGYDPSHTLVKAKQDGLKHVLFKPFRVDQLRAALTTCSLEPAVSDPKPE
jgi:CheY-like chemotaxis protein/GAF domain-containing protein